MKNDPIRYLLSLKKRHNLKECFCTNKDCSEEIIRAHSIQNNRILKRIAKNGEVYYFGKGDFDLENPNPKRYGRKLASVFTGFCGYHDQSIFKAIDNFDYEVGNKEQEFLFAYRALAKEYHAKASVVAFGEDILRERPISNFDYKIFSYFILGSRRAYDQMGRMRARFNVNLEKNRYYKVFTKSIRLTGFHPLAVSSMISLDDDFEGNQINDLADLNHDWSPIFISVFPQDSYTYVLIQCLKNEYSIFDNFFRQLETSSEHLEIKLSAMLITHCENMVISPDYFDSFPTDQREAIMGTFLEKSFDSATISDYMKYQDRNLF